MTQNTEQNVRTRDWQISKMFTALEPVSNFWRARDPEGKQLREYLEACIITAEARGAEEQRRKDAEGYLFDNPDTGTEYLPYHPIESGECQYAENVRKATNHELLSELNAAWTGWKEDRDEKAKIFANVAALESRVKELEAENITLKARVINAAETLLSIETPCMEGDNFAVTICSYFEDYEGEPCDNGWHEGATKAYEEIKDAVLQHFRAALTREGGV